MRRSYLKRRICHSRRPFRNHTTTTSAESRTARKPPEKLHTHHKSNHRPHDLDPNIRLNLTWPPESFPQRSGTVSASRRPGSSLRQTEPLNLKTLPPVAANRESHLQQSALLERKAIAVKMCGDVLDIGPCKCAISHPQSAAP